LDAGVEELDSAMRVSSRQRQSYVIQADSLMRTLDFVKIQPTGEQMAEVLRQCSSLKE
jgi:hypothetical protein